LKVAEISLPKLSKQLHSKEGFRFRLGAFTIALISSIDKVVEHLHFAYADFEPLPKTELVDFHVSLTSPAIRRCYRPQVVFSFDDHIPFLPLPLSQASAMFEWGLNWCIANNAHHFLILHAAVVEKNGRALILPGSPGSGKSTLCAALACQGWRLLSDEMALLSLADGLIYPVPRPVSLKNQSIQIIREFAPDADFGRIVTDTAKGDIAHLRPPRASVLSQSETAEPAFLVFPHYRSEGESELKMLSKGLAFMTLAKNAFNFNILGREGFDTMAHLIDRVECFDFSYPSLASALAGIDGLVR